MGHFCPPESGSGSSHSKRIRILLESASFAWRAAPAFSSAASSTAESGRRAVAMTRVPAVFRNPRTKPSPIPRDAPVIRIVRIAARINMKVKVYETHWRNRRKHFDFQQLVYLMKELQGSGGGEQNRSWCCKLAHAFFGYLVTKCGRKITSST